MNVKLKSGLWYAFAITGSMSCGTSLAGHKII